MRKKVILTVEQATEKENITLFVDNIILDGEDTSLFIKNWGAVLVALCCRYNLNFTVLDDGVLLVCFNYKLLKTVTNWDE